jgi:hypothetical protein
VPSSRISQFAHGVHPYTFERYRPALDRVRRCGGQPIPTASVAQQHLEHEILRQIGYCGITDGHGWRPGDAPFAIDWLRPLPDSLEIGVTDEALPDLLGALLPTWASGSEPWGIRGLRPRFTPKGVELHRLDLPGLLRLRGVRQRTFLRAVTVARGFWSDSDDIVHLWRTHPDRMHPEEQAHARRYDAGYAAARERRGAMASTMSALLRRHMIFRAGPPSTDVRLWLNPGGIQLEWEGGPDHVSVLDALLHPVFGMPGRVNDRCTCRAVNPAGSHCYSVEVEFDDAFVRLRRTRGGWSARREQSSARSRQRRAEALHHSRTAQQEN